jgi:cell division protein ZapD
VIGYEYPLNERIRTLLRLEDLCEKVRFYSGAIEAPVHHAALLSLFEIMEATARADLKSDLIQELERQKQILGGLYDNPEVSTDALDSILEDMEAAMHGLNETQGKIGQHLRENEWLMSIKNRMTIPGGVCEFDLPSYHFWLNQSADNRRQDLKEWGRPLQPLSAAVRIVLRILRESGHPTHYIAFGGKFQQMLAGRTAQLVRLRLANELPCAPEISANKYAINIRFMTLDRGQRPRPCEQDVPFEMTFCNL